MSIYMLLCVALAVSSVVDTIDNRYNVASRNWGLECRLQNRGGATVLKAGVGLHVRLRRL